VSAHSSFASKTLLAVQACLSVVLVAGATMLARSLDKLENQDFGYQVKGRVLVALNNPSPAYAVPQLGALYQKMEAGLAGLPGVQGVGLALYNPLTNNWGEMIYVDGHPAPKMDEASGASWDRVSSDYLQNLGVTLLRGRYFDKGDNQNAAAVAIVNQAFVKRFFRDGEDPIGEYFGPDRPQDARTYRIIGVVRDAKFAGFGLSRPARPMFYVALAQNTKYEDGDIMQRVELRSHFIGGILLKSGAAPAALEPQITRLFAGLDSNLTITSVRTMQEQIELEFDEERAVASLAGLFGVVALVLAGVGLYGVTAYAVAQRKNEIGIRMALGAGRARVVGLVLQATSVRVLAGLGVGIPLAIGAGRLISSRLYGVASWDPAALGMAAAALAGCAFVAAAIPARRAAGISVVEALRVE
jgi:predicted permease